MKGLQMALSEIVAENLRTVRKSLGVSQVSIARKARVSLSYISMLERGTRTPPLDTLEVLAKALEVSPLYLLQELDHRPKARRRK